MSVRWLIVCQILMVNHGHGLKIDVKTVGQLDYAKNVTIIDAKVGQDYKVRILKFEL